MAVLALGGLWVGSAEAAGRERGRKIEFSVPKSDEVTTNLSQLTSKKDSLKQLEEDLYKPLESFAPKSSLEGVPARPVRPPQRSAIENKRVKDLLERRKNWVFMNPDDLMNPPSLEEMLKTPQFNSDGLEKKQVAPMKDFYQRMSRKNSRKEGLTPGRTDEMFNPSDKQGKTEEAAAREESSLPGGVKDSAENLKRLFQPGGDEQPFAQGVAHGTLLDTFGLAMTEPSKEEVKAHKKFLADYQAEVDPDWKPFVTAAPENPLASLTAGAAAPAAKPAVTLPTVASTAPRTVFDAQADVVNPRLGPPALPDPNLQALGQTRAADIFPKIEPPRVVTPPPSFAAPTRSFR